MVMLNFDVGRGGEGGERGGVFDFVSHCEEVGKNGNIIRNEVI